MIFGFCGAFLTFLFASALWLNNAQNNNDKQIILYFMQLLIEKQFFIVKLYYKRQHQWGINWKLNNVVCLQFVDIRIFKDIVVKKDKQQRWQEEHNCDNETKLHDKHDAHDELNFFKLDVFFIDWKCEIGNDKTDE